MTTKKPSTHGGPGRGQGRKPIAPSEFMHVVSIRMNESQKEKLVKLGGGKWVREQIDAKVPNDTSPK